MNFHKRIYLILLPLLLSSCLHAQNQTFEEMLQDLLSHSVPEVRTSEVKKMKQEGAVLLDARALEEYAVSHIEGARWIGYSKFTKEKIADISKQKPIIVYCSVGYRSEKITEKLQEMGFQKVYNYYGGIFSWKNEGNPVVEANSQTTQRVHTYNKKWSQWLTIGEKVW